MEEKKCAETRDNLLKKIVVLEAKQAGDALTKAIAARSDGDSLSYSTGASVRDRYFERYRQNLKEAQETSDKVLTKLKRLQALDQNKVLEMLVDISYNAISYDDQGVKAFGYELFGKIYLYITRVIKEEVETSIDPTEHVSPQLRNKYSETDYLRLMESFRILWRIDKMCDREVMIEEYLEQLDLLKRYTEGFSTKFTEDLDGAFGYMTAESLKRELIPTEEKEKIKRMCSNLLDVWIAEFLRK